MLGGVARRRVCMYYSFVPSSLGSSNLRPFAVTEGSPILLTVLVNAENERDSEIESRWKSRDEVGWSWHWRGTARLPLSLTIQKQNGLSCLQLLKERYCIPVSTLVDAPEQLDGSYPSM